MLLTRNQADSDCITADALRAVSSRARNGLGMPVCYSDHLHLVSWQNWLLAAWFEDLQAVCVAQGALKPPANALQD